MKSIKIREAIRDKICDNKEEVINLFESYLGKVIPVGYSEKEVIDLSPLLPAVIKKLLIDLLEGPVSDAVVNIVGKRSRGNPLQIEEFTRQLIDWGDV